MTFDAATQRPPSAITVGSQTGLRHSCFCVSRFWPRDVHAEAGQGVGRHARGRELAVGAALDGAAVPGDGKYQVGVTFEDPGTYTIRCLASDGALNTYKDVVVQVK